jgi:hypothetical protein
MRLLTKNNLAYKHLADKHLADKHLAGKHLAGKHLAGKHLADKHLADKHLTDKHLTDKFICSTQARDHYSQGFIIWPVSSTKCQSVKWFSAECRGAGEERG